MEIFFGSTNPLLSGVRVQGKNNDTTRSLFQSSLILQSKIIMWLLAVSGLLFTIGLALNLAEALRIFKEKYGQSGPQKASRGHLKHISQTTNWTSTAFALAAVVGITQATSSLQFMSTSFPTFILVKTGVTSQALHWLIASFSIIITIGKTTVRPRKDFSQGGNGIPSAPLPPVGGGGRGGGGGPVIV